MTEFVPPVTEMDDTAYTGFECVRDSLTDAMLLLAFVITLPSVLALLSEFNGPGGCPSCLPEEPAGVTWEGEQ